MEFVTHRHNTIVLTPQVVESALSRLAYPIRARYLFVMESRCINNHQSSYNKSGRVKSEKKGVNSVPHWTIGGKQGTKNPYYCKREELYEIDRKHIESIISIGWSKLHSFIYILGTRTDSNGWEYRSNWDNDDVVESANQALQEAEIEEWNSNPRDAQGNDKHVRRRIWMTSIIPVQDLQRAQRCVHDYLQARMNVASSGLFLQSNTLTSNTNNKNDNISNTRTPPITSESGNSNGTDSTNTVNTNNINNMTTSNKFISSLTASIGNGLSQASGFSKTLNTNYNSLDESTTSHQRKHSHYSDLSPDIIIKAKVEVKRRAFFGSEYKERVICLRNQRMEVLDSTRQKEDPLIEVSLPLFNINITQSLRYSIDSKEYVLVIREEAPLNGEIKLLLHTTNSKLRKKLLNAISYQIALNTTNLAFHPFLTGPPELSENPHKVIAYGMYLLIVILTLLTHYLYTLFYITIVDIYIIFPHFLNPTNLQ
jgi:hypothetical protein